jgi:hypothetical protein
MKNLDEIFKECDYDTKLAVTAWVMENIVEHAKEGGSFRYLIYERLGFKSDAYVPLYDAGGMVISNEFDLNTKDELRKVAKDNNYDKMKPWLRLCDEPDCYNEITCGTPTETGYRNTCGKHKPDLKKQP